MTAAYHTNKTYLKYASDRINYKIGKIKDERRIEQIKLFTENTLKVEEDTNNKKTMIKTKR